jgi:DNA-binding transcriptional MerR regulator
VGENEHTIDDLASLSRIPSRTIRFYQSKGALQPPVVRGRVAFYGPQHLERLKLIAQLQDRGLRIDAIREVTNRIDKGELDVSEWLGLDAQLRAPWADDRPRTMTAAEVVAENHREGLIADLVRAKVIVREGDVYFVESPSLLRMLLKLEAAGIGVEHAMFAVATTRKYLARVSRELADYFVAAVRNGEIQANLDEIRPLALEGIRLVFAREMERVLRGLVEQGRTTKLATKKKKASR